MSIIDFITLSIFIDILFKEEPSLGALDGVERMHPEGGGPATREVLTQPGRGSARARPSMGKVSKRPEWWEQSQCRSRASEQVSGQRPETEAGEDIWPLEVEEGLLMSWVPRASS